MIRYLTIAALFVVLFAGADWTCFRGPDGTGVSDDTGLPVTWSTTKNVVWKTPLPGFGSSSPITLGDKIFLTSYSGYGLDQDQPGNQDDLALHALCLDRASGRIVWDKTTVAALPETPYDGGRVSLHGYASSTPVTDGKAVYFFLGKSGVSKYSLNGERLWNVSVGTDLDKHRWGSGTSLILHDDLLIVNASAESRSIRALRASDGEQVWQVDGIVDSWSTPSVVTTADDGKELVVVDRSKVLGLDPATGKQLWICTKPSDYVCPSVIADEGIVYIINSRFKALLMAIRAGGRGDVTESNVLWSKRWTTRVSTPILHDGHLYAVDQAGVASCIDLESGDEVFRERLDISGGGDKVYASLIAADGKAYAVSRVEGTVVFALAPDFKLLAHNHLGDTSVFNATPAVSNSQLLLRSDNALYCIGLQ